MSQRRVVITGMGAVTPIGNSVADTWKSIMAGECGIDKITLFDTTDYAVKIAAEVKNFNLTDWVRSLCPFISEASVIIPQPRDSIILNGRPSFSLAET